MNTDDSSQPAAAEASEPKTASEARADAHRQRFRQAQLIAAQVARVRAAGAAPKGADADRLVAEFHARGGQVTVCPAPDDAVAADAPSGRSGHRASAAREPRRNKRPADDA